MTDKHVQAEAPHSNMEKDPSDWVTGDEPMTGAQKSYLKTLSEEAGAEFDESLTKAAASEQIDALQKTTGRGAGHMDRHPAASGETEVTPKAKAKAKADPEDDSPARGKSTSEAPVADSDAPEGDLFEGTDARAGSAR